jgi:NADPH:quinone reductase-like Zn-dependent oxidoreductase
LGAASAVDYTLPGFTKELELYDIIFIAVDKFPFAVCKNFLKEVGVYLNVTSPFKSPAMIWTGLVSDKKIFTGENPPESAGDLAELALLAETGVLKPVIDRRYTFSQIVEAHRYVDQGHKTGNVVLTWI